MGSPPYRQPSIHHTDFKDKDKCVSFESVNGKEVPTHRCTRKPLWALAGNGAIENKRDELIEELIDNSHDMSESTIQQQTRKLAQVSMCRQCGQSYERMQEVAEKIASDLVDIAKVTPRPTRQAYTPQAPVRLFDGPLPTPQSSRYGTPTPILPTTSNLPPSPASSVTYGRRSPTRSPQSSNFSQQNPFQRSQARKTSRRPPPAPSTPTPHPIFGDEIKVEGGFSNENVFQNSPDGEAKTMPTSHASPGPKNEPADDPSSQTTPPSSFNKYLVNLGAKIQSLERQLESKDEEIMTLRREKSDLGLQVQTLNSRIQKLSKVMAEYLNGLGAGVQRVTEELHRVYTEDVSEEES